MRSINERDVDRVRMTMDQVASSASQDVGMFNNLFGSLGGTIDPQFGNLHGLPAETTVGQVNGFNFFLSWQGPVGEIVAFFTQPQ